MTHNEKLKKIQEYSVSEYEKNNNVKVHITKLDYEKNHKYNTVGGIWVNGELTKTYELTDITNEEIDEFIKTTNKLVRARTLFSI